MVYWWFGYPDSCGAAKYLEASNASYSLNIGKSNTTDSRYKYYFQGALRDIEMYDTVVEYNNISTGITLNKTTDELVVGDTDTLIAAVTPDDIASKGVTWSSSDSSVASVDKTTGKVTAVSAGTVTITATTIDGKTQACTINVKAQIDTTAVLTLKMVDGSLEKYYLSKSGVDDFVTWYKNRSNGTGNAYYVFTAKPTDRKSVV